jgi:hypothetical protein
MTIPLDMPRDEADALARFLKRCTYAGCGARSHRMRKYPDGREEVDVIWAAVRWVPVRQLRTAIGGGPWCISLPPGTSPIIISESPTHVIALELRKSTLLRKMRFLETLIDAATSAPGEEAPQ